MRKSSPTPPTKRPRGRPKLDENTEFVGLRWPAIDLEAIDKWRRTQEDLPPRTEAIRRLVRLGFTVKPKR